jgi:hypothetical protein
MEFHLNRSSVASHLRVEVKHRCAAPKRYTWEIFSEGKTLPVEESTDRFRSWEEASQAGKKALEEIISKILCGLNPNLASGHRGTKLTVCGSHPTTQAERSESFETA